MATFWQHFKFPQALHVKLLSTLIDILTNISPFYKFHLIFVYFHRKFNFLGTFNLPTTKTEKTEKSNSSPTPLQGINPLSSSVIIADYSSSKNDFWRYTRFRPFYSLWLIACIPASSISVLIVTAPKIVSTCVCSKQIKSRFKSICKHDGFAHTIAEPREPGPINKHFSCPRLTKCKTVLFLFRMHNLRWAWMIYCKVFALIVCFICGPKVAYYTKYVWIIIIKIIAVSTEGFSRWLPRKVKRKGTTNSTSFFCFLWQEFCLLAAW